MQLQYHDQMIKANQKKLGDTRNKHTAAIEGLESSPGGG